MTPAVEARMRHKAEARAESMAAQVAERVSAEAPGASVTVEQGRVIVTGRGLDAIAGLRWIGGLLR